MQSLIVDAWSFSFIAMNNRKCFAVISTYINEALIYDTTNISHSGNRSYYS